MPSNYRLCLWKNGATIGNGFFKKICILSIAFVLNFFLYIQNNTFWYISYFKWGDQNLFFISFIWLTKLSYWLLFIYIWSFTTQILYTAFYGFRDTVLNIAKHYETGESLPEDVYLKLLSARTFRVGSSTLRSVISLINQFYV